MAENKKSIIVYADWIDHFEELTDEEAGLLIKHFFRYVNDLKPIAPNRIIDIAFNPIKACLKRDLDKWEKTLQERSVNGRLGNIKKYNIDLYNQIQSDLITLEQAEEIAKHRKASLPDSIAIKTVAKVADNVSVSDSVNVNITSNKENHEFFKNECLQSQQFLEAVAMKEKIPLDKMQFALTDFNVHLVTTGEIKKDLKEYKYHFTSWVRKMKELKQKEVQQKNKDRL